MSLALIYPEADSNYWVCWMFEWSIVFVTIRHITSFIYFSQRLISIVDLSLVDYIFPCFLNIGLCNNLSLLFFYVTHGLH